MRVTVTIDIDAVDDKTLKEIKEEFARVERRAGILDKGLSEYQRIVNERLYKLTQSLDVLGDERLDGDEMLLERIIKLEKAHAAQANTGGGEGSGVERTLETEQVQEKPSGQGKETGGASGYIRTNIRRDDADDRGYSHYSTHDAPYA